MERIAATTMKVLAFLQAHAKIRQVYFPPSTGNARLGLGAEQLRGASGLVTIELVTESVAAVERFCDALTRFLMTVSWGGYESLAFPVSAVFPRDAPMRSVNGTPLGLVRLSIGLEDPDILIADLSQALAHL